jgi:hypothetical protein
MQSLSNSAKAEIIWYTSFPVVVEKSSPSLNEISSTPQARKQLLD